MMAVAAGTHAKPKLFLFAKLSHNFGYIHPEQGVQPGMRVDLRFHLSGPSITV